MTGRFPPLDKARVLASHDRAALRYDEAAAVERAIAGRLLERLDLIRLDPSWIIDLGTATGHCARALARRYRRARVLLLDIAPAMLHRARAAAPRWRARSHYLCADAEYLPIADTCVDLVVSNLALQWCNDPAQVFAHCRRVLRPGGLLLFSTLGPATLRELRSAWARVDHEPHVQAFFDMHDVGDALIRAGLSGPVMEAEMITLHYPDALALMRDLKALGARSALVPSRRGLRSRRTLEVVIDAYEHYRAGELVPATCEVVYGHAWCPTAATRPQDGSSVAAFPLSALKRRS